MLEVENYQGPAGDLPPLVPMQIRAGVSVFEQERSEQAAERA